MKKKLYSVALGPISEGKPSKVEIVLAESFTQVSDSYENVPFPSDILSIQLLPDEPVIL